MGGSTNHLDQPPTRWDRQTEIYRKYDVDGDGELTVAELTEGLAAAGIKSSRKNFKVLWCAVPVLYERGRSATDPPTTTTTSTHPLTTPSSQALVKELDVDGSGTISLAEWSAGASSQLS